MFCPRCGQYNADGSVFCSGCGSPFRSSTTGQPSVVQYPPPQAPYAPGPQPPKKSRKGLTIGLVAGGVALIAAAVTLILLLPGGPSIVGLWYSEARGEVLEFRDNGRVYGYDASGEYKGRYEYDPRSGEGVAEFDGEEYAFTVDKNRIAVEDFATFRRADEDFDTDDFIAEAALAVTAETAPTQAPTEAPTPKPTPAPTVQTVSNQSMSLSFSFGERTGTYTGEVEDGLPNGYGTFSSQNPSGVAWTYEGEWAHGHFSGQGTSTFEDGYVHTGHYESDQLTQGQVYYGGCLVYDGEFLNGTWHGYGVYYNPHGEAVYAGSWANGFIQETAEARAARQETFMAQSAALSYDELYQECQNETGLHVQIQGVVFYVFESEANPNICECLIYVDGVESADTIVSVWYYLSEGEPKVTNGQTITVWGAAENLYSYTTEEDAYLTVPNVEAWFVE